MTATNDETPKFSAQDRAEIATQLVDVLDRTITVKSKVDGKTIGLLTYIFETREQLLAFKAGVWPIVSVQ